MSLQKFKLKSLKDKIAEQAEAKKPKKEVKKKEKKEVKKKK